jgi:hypothetical protein
MQNVRDYSTVKLHTSGKSALKAISNPTFKNYTILGENLVQTNHFTPTIVHDKPIAIGFSILELVNFKFFSKIFLKFFKIKLWHTHGESNSGPTGCETSIISTQ